MLNSLYVLLYHQTKVISVWTSGDTEKVLYSGDQLYQQIGKTGLLLPSDLPKFIIIFNRKFQVIEKQSHIGSFLFPNIVKQIISISDFNDILSTDMDYLMCLYDLTVAIIKESGESFLVFDPHSRDYSRLLHESGKALLLHFSSMLHLSNYVRQLAVSLSLIQFLMNMYQILKSPQYLSLINVSKR